MILCAVEQRVIDSSVDQWHMTACLRVCMSEMGTLCRTIHSIGYLPNSLNPLLLFLMLLTGYCIVDLFLYY